MYDRPYRGVLTGGAAFGLGGGGGGGGALFGSFDAGLGSRGTCVRGLRSGVGGVRDGFGGG